MIKVKNKSELQEEIKESILQNGLHADLNYIDIGSLEKVESIFNNSHYCRNLYNWNLQRPDLKLDPYIKPELLEYKFNERWIDYGKT